MKKSITAIVVLAAGIASILFLVPILGNVHNAYLRVISNSTVKLTNKDRNSGATGFVVRGRSGEKYILTNTHVCNLAGEDKTLLATYHGDEFEVSVYRKYLWNDLCVMKAHRPLGLPLHIASSVRLGEEIYVMGHPLLEPTSVSPGEISGSIFIEIAMGVNITPQDCSGPTYRLIDTRGSILELLGADNICIRTVEANPSNASTQPGNSGSPVVNIYGSVVGVDFAGNNSGRAYFVPLEDIKLFLDTL